jgi:hypothetical protein
MPPYHTLIAGVLTIYLDLIAGSDGTLGDITDNILQQLAADWGPIATANSLTITFAFGPLTPAPINPTPAGITAVFNATPPANIQFFRLTVGRGVGAIQASQSARISYVNYPAGIGYIYEIPNDPAPIPSFVPAVSHEVGHILGLSDRYYQAVYYLENRAIDRTCRQIRKGEFEIGGIDYRDGVTPTAATFGTAPTPATFADAPRLAVRLPLPLSNQMVNDFNYTPLSNLMSTGANVLTPAQVAIVRGQAVEPTYRIRNWVAILLQWRRYAVAPTNLKAGTLNTNPDYTYPGNWSDLSTWPYPAWEASPQDGGQGLLFLPPGSTTPYRYCCLTATRRGRDAQGDVINPTRIAAAMGRTRVFAFGGTTYNVIAMNIIHPNWMCYMRRMLNDLTQMP